MEYPIIETLTNAYIRNGWTGLNVSTGKNLAYIDLIGYCPSISNGNIIQYDYAVTSNYIKVNPNNNYTLTVYSNISDLTSVYVFYYNEDDSFISYRSMPLTQNTITILTPINCEYLYIRMDKILPNTDNPVIQFENGTVSTPYEPYSSTTDIFSRTRLPLIRYFPHPVIDSLQRASNGTMTADDVQILRHYLTKFGVGNIELGRFHAINPNVSDDIREIDLEPIPIDDEPIKEKKTGEEDLNVKTE